jgi:hypothetical protein
MLEVCRKMDIRWTSANRLTIAGKDRDLTAVVKVEQPEVEHKVGSSVRLPALDGEYARFPEAVWSVKGILIQLWSFACCCAENDCWR